MPQIVSILRHRIPELKRKSRANSRKKYFRALCQELSKEMWKRAGTRIRTTRRYRGKKSKRGNKRTKTANWPPKLLWGLLQNCNWQRVTEGGRYSIKLSLEVRFWILMVAVNKGNFFLPCISIYLPTNFVKRGWKGATIPKTSLDSKQSWTPVQ